MQQFLGWTWELLLKARKPEGVVHAAFAQAGPTVLGRKHARIANGEL
jgi:hypothetical protein